MASSPELKTLVKCHEELIVVTRNNLQAISRFLLLEEIIGYGSYREITDINSYHTDHDRAKIILRCLEDKVEEDVNYYSVFYDFLSKEKHFELTSLMNEAIVRFRKKKSRLIEDSEKIALSIKNKGKIKRKTAHIMIIGFPGSGKSHLLDNLLGQKRRDNSSTDISDPVVIVDCTDRDTGSHISAFGQGSSWNKVSSFEYSAMNQLQHCDKRAISDEKPLLQFEKQGPLDKMLQHSTATKPESTTSLQNDISRVLEQSNITSYEELKSTFSLYIRDTGGQVEFQEVLSILINGPSIFFFVIKADLSLDKAVKMEYRKDDVVIASYESATTTQQALVQTLTTIQNTDEPTDVTTHSPVVFIIGTHTDKIEPREYDQTINKLNAELHELIASHKFDIVIYQDEPSNAVIFPVSNTNFEAELKKFEDIKERVDQIIERMRNFTIDYPLGYLLFSLELQHCKDSVLYRKECEEIAAKFQITGDEEVTKMLKTLHHRIGIIQYYNIDGLKHLVIIKPEILFKKLTQLMVKTFPLYQGRSPKIKPDLRKGIIEASELEHLFTEDNEMKPKDNKMKPKDFITFLEHLRIAASFNKNENERNKNEKTEENSVKYFFIPSVIHHSLKREISEIREVAKSKVCPLAVTFKSSSCPKGVFGMTVCHFMSKEKKENQYTFSLEKENIYRDIVCLKMSSSHGTQGKVFLCQFSNTHIEVRFCPDEDEDFIILAPLCNRIRTTLMEGILQSLPKLNYNKDQVGATESLKCPLCKELHIMEEKKERISFRCNDERKYPGNCCSCWFNKVETQASPSVKDCGAGIQQVPTTDKNISRTCMDIREENTGAEPSPQPKRPCLGKNSGMDIREENTGAEASPQPKRPCLGAASPSLTSEDLITVFEEVIEAKTKWRYIGLKLGVSSGDLTGIASNSNNIDDKLMETLTKWLQSGKNTTWKALAEAMGSKSVQRQDLKSAILTSHPS